MLIFFHLASRVAALLIASFIYRDDPVVSTGTGAACESRCGYLANYRNITQGFHELFQWGGGGCGFIHGALGGTLSFPSLILITGELLEDTKSPGGLESLLDQQFTLSYKCHKHVTRHFVSHAVG